MKIVSSDGKEYKVDKYLEYIWLEVDNGMGEIEEFRGHLVASMNGLVYFFYQRYTDMYELDYTILEDYKLID